MTDAGTNWTAPWIWLSRHDQEASCALLARKAFDLQSLPAEASLRISANHIYRLYVNGACVGRGPDRADPRFPYFDTYAIRSYLKEGVNVIVILVYHCRTAMRTWALYDGAGGLTLELRAGMTVIETGSDWRMTRAEAWQSTEQRGTKFRGPLHRVNLGKLDQIDSALNPNYDDSGWEVPEIRKDDLGMPLPAETPRLLSVERLPVHSGSIRASLKEIEWADPRRGTFLFPQEMVVYPGEQGSWLIYDFGRTMGGFPVVEFDSVNGGEVDLYAGESLTWLPEELLHLSKAGLQRYESLDWRGARYLALNFRNLTGPVTIKRVSFNEMVYPFDDRGDFICSDPLLGKIWRVSRETARINVKDHPVDCCGREQALWLADLTVHCRALSACFGDLRPMEKAVKQALRAMREDGVVPVPGPATLGYEATCERLPWSGQALHLGLILRQIYWDTGQTGIVEWALPRLEKVYGLFGRYEDDRGLLNTHPDLLPALQAFCGWNPMQKEGIAAGLNFEYILSLQAAAELATACAHPALAQAWSAKAERAKASAIAAFWDSRRCVFTDGEREAGQPSDAVSITVNALGALAGAVDPLLRGAWADYLRRDASVLAPVSPLDASLLLEAYAALDLDLHFRDLIETYYGSIIQAGEPTLPEFWSYGVNGARYWGDLSRCHAYGAAPAYLLPAYVIGVRPLAPGWRKVTIEPRHLGLEHASGRIPTPHGDLVVQWRREMLSWELQVELPVGMTAEVILPKLGWGNQRLRHNGRVTSETKGWPRFSAHSHRAATGLPLEKLAINLETPGRHLVQTEAF